MSRAKGFTQIHNYIINDERLSLRAKGLYAIIASKQKLKIQWTWTIENICRATKEGRDSVRKILKELEESGHIKSSKIRGQGRFAGRHIVVSNMVLPVTEKPSTVKSTDNNTLLKNNQVTNNINKDKRTKRPMRFGELTGIVESGMRRRV